MRLINIDLLKNKLNKEFFTKFLEIVFLSLGFLVVFSYSIGVNDYDEYDFLEGVYWAKAFLSSKSITSSNFVYQYYIPFGSNLIMAPFVALFGPSLIANQLGMCVFYLIYILIIVALSKELFKDSFSQSLFVIVSSLFIFTSVGDNLLHHLLYYGIAYICFLGEILVVLKIIFNRNYKYLPILLFFSFYSALNGITTIALSSLPLILSIIYLCFFKKENSQIFLNKKTILIVVLILITSLVGLLLNNYVSKDIIFCIDNNCRFIIDTVQHMYVNLTEDFFSYYLDFFNCNKGLIGFFCVDGVLRIFEILVALIVFVFILKSMNVNNFKDEKHVFTFACCCFTIAICLLQYTISTRSCERFLFNAFTSALIICALNFCIKDEYHKILPLLLLLFILFSISVSELRTLHGNADVVEKKEKIIQVLKDNNVNYVWCSVSDGMPIYVLSKGEISYTYTIFEDTAIYQENGNNYVESLNKPANDETVFAIMVTKDVYKNDLLPFYSDIINLSSKKIIVDDEYIFIFDISYWDIFQERMVLLNYE